MKRTGSTDEAVQSNGQVPASGHDTGLNENSTMHQRRRRLVRGAAALAPLVLTLRSGALAAASCTGVKGFYNVASNGQIDDASDGDWCATGYQACSDHKIDTQFGALLEQVQEQGHSGKYKCPTFTGQVALLSSGAHTSIVNS